MLRFLFAFILLIHGLIHLMGFAKAFKYAEIEALQSEISRQAGLWWLLAAVLFTASALLFLAGKDAWWMIAIPAIAVSQVLIFRYWQDARFGTLANVIALAGVLLAWGNWNFQRMVDRERQNFLPPTLAAETTLTHDRLAALPPVVQHWLERSNSIGKPMTQTVHLRQTGQMRTDPSGKWMPVTAEQYCTTGKPGFFWTTSVQAAPYIDLAGRDKYEDGKGFMLIKLLSLFPVADASGPETDQGAMLRYLGELVWYPSAALQPYLQWEALDSLSAKVTMRYSGLEASGIFTFSPEGDVLRFEAMRYFSRKSGATLEKWQVSTDPNGFREFQDIRIPARCAVSWLLESGEFNWFNLEVTELEYE